MKYHAILFMCNDEKRARFVIENFTTYNPDIPLTVYNGGEKMDHLATEYNIELIQGENLWHKKTRHAPGSFNFGWFEMLFMMHEKYDPDYLIFLETDVKVTRKIHTAPIYDIAGAVTSNGGIVDSLIMYDYWDAYIKGQSFHEHQYSNWTHKFHTGMGGTALSRNFFQKCKEKLYLVKECYDTIPLNCYQDMVITCFARSQGCTMGDWPEVSDTRGTLRKIADDKWYSDALDETCALIHNYKI